MYEPLTFDHAEGMARIGLDRPDGSNVSTFKTQERAPAFAGR
jgi:hypothetical protein